MKFLAAVLFACVVTLAVLHSAYGTPVPPPNPEAPVANPEAPVPNPEAPVPNPEAPVADPAAPMANPGVSKSNLAIDPKSPKLEANDEGFSQNAEAIDPSIRGPASANDYAPALDDAFYAEAVGNPQDDVPNPVAPANAIPALEDLAADAPADQAILV
ncbi:predicted GPI-anchored protein 58 [Drosophila hydei]|uniref:Predicted GPI-anchored protein 58 n=1 Tax=Drosophila hydei TaxID=7224 RepID=A0A6J1LGR8_DROHY|nr:predicted GPI-anchored protein 58 [Drosophila hydei]